jgi:hypothetical protein
MSGATARVNIYGGELVVRDATGIAVNYDGRTGGSIHMKAPGKLIIGTPDPVLGINDDTYWVFQIMIDNGQIINDDPGNTIFVKEFTGENSILHAVTSYYDLNFDNTVDFADFAMFANEWQQIRHASIARPNNLNAIIFAPKIASAITVDGSFSDWTTGSEWATFGDWSPLGSQKGLASTTKAKYAWDNDANLLYIAIESTEPNRFAEFQLGLGVTGPPVGGESATEMKLQYNGSSVVITPRIEDNTTTGVVAAQTWDGTTLRLEIATPLYSAWWSEASKLDLTADMNVFAYVNILATVGGVKKGDSQCVDYFSTFFNGDIRWSGSKIRLLDSLPVTAANLQAAEGSNYADFSGNGSVGIEDLALFVGDWLK